MESLKTGDVILYSKQGSSWFSSITGMLSNNSNANKTEYFHCGMILRDPTFVHSSLKGLYVWQTKWTHNLEDSNNDSSDSDSDTESNTKNGEDDTSEPTASESTASDPTASESTIDDLSIEIVPLRQVIDEYNSQNITARVLSCDTNKCGNNCLTTEQLSSLHSVITEDPKNIFPQEEIKGVLGYCDLSSYDWSATFLGYLYTKCNLLSKETQWHLLRSQDFAANTENLRFSNCASLNAEELDLA